MVGMFRPFWSRNLIKEGKNIVTLMTSLPFVFIL